MTKELINFLLWNLGKEYARNQLGTPGEAKNFLRGAHVLSCFIKHKPCPTHFFPGGGKKFTPLSYAPGHEQ